MSGNNRNHRQMQKTPQYVNEKDREIEQLRQRVGELEGLLEYTKGAASGGAGSLFERYRRVVAFSVELKTLIDHYEEITPFMTLNWMDLPDDEYKKTLTEMLQGESPDGDQWSSCLVGLTIVVRDSPTSTMTATTLEGFYPGTREEVITALAARANMLIAGMPQMEDIPKALPPCLEPHEALNIFYRLARVRREPQKYSESRKEEAEMYWNTYKDDPRLGDTCTKAKATATFRDFIDHGFENMDKHRVYLDMEMPKT